MRTLTFLLLVILGSCHGELRLSRESWIELTSDHFILRTDVDESDARAAIDELEQTRSVFLRGLAWGGKEQPARPFLVIELADRVEVHEFTRAEIIGFVAPFGHGEQVVVFNGDDAPENQKVLKHELAHAVAGQMLRRQPAWFAEGLACFLENTKRDPDADRDIIGEIDNDKVTWLAQHTLMPATQIMSTPGASELEGNEGARFELSAYEMFHMLFNQRPAGLAAYMRMLAHGDDPKAAFTAAFPDLTLEKIDAMVLESQQFAAHYVKLGVPLEAYRGPIAVRALPPADLHAQLGQLFAISPGIEDRAGPKARAHAEFEQALAIDPGNPEALRGMFALEKMSRAARIEAARRAVALHPDSWHAQVLLVDVLARPFGEKEERPAALDADKPASDEELAAAEAAYKLAPEQSDVLAIYADVLDERSRSDEALPIAKRAVSLDPSNPNALAALARALGGAHREAEGLSLLQRAIELTPERASKSFVTMLLALQQRLEAQQSSALSAATATAQLVQTAQGTQVAPGIPKATLPFYPHDTRVQIDRPPSRTSCPTAGPALPGAGPASAQKAEVRYVVGEDGKVKKVERVSGSEEPIAAIRAWLLTCTFEPGRRGGNPVDAEVREVFNFVSK